MHSTKKVSNEEFDNLIKRISQLQKDSDGISAEEIAAVFSNDPELLKAYVEYNFEEKNRKKKKGLLVNAALLLLAVPLSVFGGYKAREAVARFFPLPGQDELLTQFEAQKKETESLQAEKAEFMQKIEKQEERIDELIENIGDPNAVVTTPKGDNSPDIDDEEDSPDSEQKNTSDVSPESSPKIGTPPKSAEEVGSNTPSGSLLQAGQTWTQDGVVVTVTDPSVKSQCEDGLVQFNLTLSNFSGKDQLVRFSGNDLAVDVNNAFSSNYSWSTNPAVRNNCKTSASRVNASSASNYLVPHRYLEIKDLKNNETVELYITFFGELMSYEDKIRFHLEKAGPIDKAKWLLNPLPES